MANSHERPATASSSNSRLSEEASSTISSFDLISFDDSNAPAIAPRTTRDTTTTKITDEPPSHEIVIIGHEVRDAEEEEYLIRLLSRRAMHLPNLNWAQDWLQFMKNNHPLFGIFFYHRLHPLKWGHRLYILLASTAFGLAATNCVYLYYVKHDDEMDKVLIEIGLDESSILNFKHIEALEVTYGMASLWTFGGVLHSIFDICMWYLSACACFLNGASCGKRGKFQMIGTYIVIALAAVLLAFAIFVVLMRAAYDTRLRLAEEGLVLSDFEWQELGRVRNFSFLTGYGIELCLVYFAYFPLLITVMFVGILPCVGRPKEMKKQYRERLRREEKYNIDGIDGDVCIAVYDENGDACV
jgi:hypothetical protein